MDTGLLKLGTSEVKYSILKDANDNWIQIWYSVVPNRSEKIKDQLNTIEQAENDFFEELGISRNSIAAKRIFSSDLTVHHDEIALYKQRQTDDFFFSTVEQPPSSNRKLVLLGMCFNNITKKYRANGMFCLETDSKVKHLFAECLTGCSINSKNFSEDQTDAIFNELKDKLAQFNATIKDNLIRTWLYAPDIEADYAGIVKARKEFFVKNDLTENTHHVASTGIQGKSGEMSAGVFMDAYALTGIDAHKIRYIHVPDHMNAAHAYGVTFERATMVEMESVLFLFISGTASIDHNGDIVHPGDVEKQTQRVLQNISALVKSAQFAREDLSSLIVYLRDNTDYCFVKPIVDKFAGSVPVVYVQAPVCRPGWLVEIEATAVKLHEA